MNGSKVSQSNIASLAARRNDIRLVSADTPWGKAESVTEIADGIFLYHTTASRGGYRLSSRRNANVPLVLKKATVQQFGLKGWYEEDVDWAIVVHSFPECFDGEYSYRAIEDTESLSYRGLETALANCWVSSRPAGLQKTLLEFESICARL